MTGVMMTTTMMMSGRMKMSKFVDLYNQQMDFQSGLIRRGIYEDYGVEGGEAKLPADYPRLESYQIQQLISEIGEVLEADKRWKSFRNGKYDPEGKKDEIADCFIVLMNVAAFSGLSGEEILSAIENKIKVNNERKKSL